MNVSNLFYYKCPSCKGQGGRENPAWADYNKKIADCTWDYTKQIPDSYLTCGNCNGSGRKGNTLGQFLDVNRKVAAQALRRLASKVDV